MLNIVVVEDYDILREELVFHLSRPGWQVSGVGDGAALDQHLGTQHVDVVVLDLNLPGEDGVSIARRLREQHPAMGLIMLTARNAPEHRASGFTAGADVYLTKPAQTTEIEAVIQNMQRRMGPSAAPDPCPSTPAAGLQVRFQLRLSSGQLTLPDGNTVHINPTQAQLLHLLARHYPAAASLQALGQALRTKPEPPEQTDAAASANQLRVQISRLRAKWQQVCPDERLIEPVHGTGYRLTHAIDCIDADPA